MKKAVIILSFGVIFGLNAMDSPNMGSLPQRNPAQVWGGTLIESNLPLPDEPVFSDSDEEAIGSDPRDPMEIEPNN